MGTSRFVNGERASFTLIIILLLASERCGDKRTRIMESERGVLRPPGSVPLLDRLQD